MNALDGSSKKNLTNNGVEVPGAHVVDDSDPVFSPDGKSIAYESYGEQTYNPVGDYEVYRVNALDGSERTNLTNNGADVDDYAWAVYAPGGTRIAYLSRGVQVSNPEGDYEIYRMNTSDGSSKKNLTDNAAEYDESPE